MELQANASPYVNITGRDSRTTLIICLRWTEDAFKGNIMRQRRHAQYTQYNNIMRQKFTCILSFPRNNDNNIVFFYALAKRSTTTTTTTTRGRVFCTRRDL